MKRAIREFAVGITLALTLGGVATAVLSESFDQQPRFGTTATTTDAATDGPDADPNDPLDPEHPTTVTPIVPTSKGELRLMMAYGPFEQARESESAYSVVTMAQLGQQFPRVGFVRADRPSMSEGEVSVLIASPEILVLATLDGAGCVWLHELGGGPEITHSDDPSACAASSAPLEGWAPITAA